MRTWLLDTGPIVAYFDPHDPAHDQCLQALGNFGGGLITTGAVIGEAMHFLADHANGPALLIEFLQVTDVQIVECCHQDDLRSALTLMTKYADSPMDFADATLVLVADRLSLHHICTLDRRGFNTFRTARGKRFSLVIDGG